MGYPAARLAVLACLGMVAGCATMLDGTGQSILVEARSGGAPVSGARCVLRNDGGEAWLTTPGSATVPADRSDLKVLCTRSGFEDRDASAVSEVKPEVLGNLLVGGLIGFGVDHFGGAGYQYPSRIVVEMSPRPAALAASAQDAVQARAASGRESAAASRDELRALELARRTACQPVAAPLLHRQEHGERHYRLACGDGRTARIVCQPEECHFGSLGD